MKYILYFTFFQHTIFVRYFFNHLKSYVVLFTLRTCYTNKYIPHSLHYFHYFNHNLYFFQPLQMFHLGRTSHFSFRFNIQICFDLLFYTTKSLSFFSPLLYHFYYFSSSSYRILLYLNIFISLSLFLILF